MESTKETIGDVLKRLRGEIAQAIIAKKADVSQAVLSDYELNKCRPSADAARRILDALDASDADRLTVKAQVLGPHVDRIADTDGERRAILDEILPPTSKVA